VQKLFRESSYSKFGSGLSSRMGWDSPSRVKKETGNDSVVGSDMNGSCDQRQSSDSGEHGSVVERSAAAAEQGTATNVNHAVWRLPASEDLGQGDGDAVVPVNATGGATEESEAGEA
jgi:hypothetical protein